MNFSETQIEQAAEVLFLEDDRTLIDTPWKQLNRHSRARKHYRRLAIRLLPGIVKVIDPHYEDRQRKSGVTEYEGRIYGTWPVLLQRGTEVRVGTRMGRYGGIMATYDNQPFHEESDKWWEAQGWTIVNPPLHDEAHARFQEAQR